jgi:hypothetical protein
VDRDSEVAVADGDTASSPPNVKNDIVRKIIVVTGTDPAADLLERAMRLSFRARGYVQKLLGTNWIYSK